MTRSLPTRCATHPDVETNLRCGKCGKPICPRCMVQTPVGARCPDCARLYKLPTYRISGKYYLRGAVVGLVVAAVIGLIWGLVTTYLPFYFFSLIIAYGAGWLIGEMVSRAANRKRGSYLAVLGAAAVVICYGVFYLIDYLITGSLDFSLFRSLINLAAFCISIYITVNRLR